MVYLKDRFFANKQELRQAVWAYMEEHHLVTFPRPCFGRIPNFHGAEAAAARLATIPEWQEARVIFAAPDSALHPARAKALENGKALLVAAPRITGFYLLKGIPPEEAFQAASIKGFEKFGQPVKLGPDLPKVGLYLTGAVAVDRQGNRIGKGAGYGDQEDLLLSQAKLIDENTPRVVLVHDIQVFEDFSTLMRRHDRRIDLIVTPERIYRIHWVSANNDPH
jgi:5-formyltetrahydrofolate cyclo-ligase